VCDCGRLKDIYHFFLSYDFFGKISYDISSWIGFTKIHPNHGSGHLLQFGTLDGFSKNICTILHLIWLSCVWVIWRERNARVFPAKEESFTTS